MKNNDNEDGKLMLFAFLGVFLLMIWMAGDMRRSDARQAESEVTTCR